MKCGRPIFLSLVLFSVVVVTNPIFAAPQSLAARIEEVTSQPEYKNAHWGILIVEQNSTKVLYEHNADKLFAPASTTKLYTVATALDAFGPDHQFETTVYRRGNLTGAGQLNGDLILVPGGDLTLGGRTDKSGAITFTDVDHTYADGSNAHALTAPDPLAGLDELARQAAAGGLKHVRGEVVIDDRLFEHATSTGSGPAQLTPIIVNDNIIDFLITAGKAGTLAAIEWRPKSIALQVDARVETAEVGSESRVRITTPGPGRMVVRGRIAEGSQPMLRVQEVDDPAAFARALFIEALQRAGVVVDASPLASNRAELLPARGKYAAEQRLALLKSPPFSEEAKLILKVSHNLHASTLPLLVAAKHGRRTLADGLHLEHDFLSRAGVDVDSISFGGGAGGSRSDYTTPQATVQLLRYMMTRPDFAAYEAALPVLGVDGTLATSVDPASPARGKVHAKTGTLGWENTMNGSLLLTSKALAGYMTTANGRKLIIALYVNNVPLKNPPDPSRVGRTLGHLCEVIYDDVP